MTSFDRYAVFDSEEKPTELSMFVHSVVVEEDKVLLLKGYRNDNYWAFPGMVCQDQGYITAMATTMSLERQVGLGHKIMEGLREPFIFRKDGVNRLELFFNYLVNVYSQGSSRRPESKDFSWHYVHNLPNPAAPNVVPALKFFGHKSAKERRF